MASALAYVPAVLPLVVALLVVAILAADENQVVYLLVVDAFRGVVDDLEADASLEVDANRVAESIPVGVANQVAEHSAEENN